MVGAGWGHDCLMAMAESDFRFLLEHQLAWDRAKAEARREAANG